MFVKIGDFNKFKGFLVEFLQNRRSSENQKPQKIAKKWIFLSLAFCNAPSLHTVKKILTGRPFLLHPVHFSLFRKWGIQSSLQSVAPNGGYDPRGQEKRRTPSFWHLLDARLKAKPSWLKVA